jgi:electron transport complex protein RnfG
MKEAFRYSIILGLICFLASAILTVVNALTAPQIVSQKQEGVQAALREVCPGASYFEADSQEGEVGYYRAYNKDKSLVGFALKAEAKGYSSLIEALVGLDASLHISAIKVLSQNETPGLGSRIAEPAFQSQFKGKDSSSLSNAEAITGATISSKAVIDAVASAIDALKPQLLKEINDAR